MPEQLAAAARTLHDDNKVLHKDAVVLRWFLGVAILILIVVAVGVPWMVIDQHHATRSQIQSDRLEDRRGQCRLWLSVQSALSESSPRFGDVLVEIAREVDRLGCAPG